MAAMTGQLLVVCVLVLHAQWTSAQSGPNYCTYADEKFTCDYTSMGPTYRPIDYTSFTIEPQIIDLTVNGFLPYFGTLANNKS